MHYFSRIGKLYVCTEKIWNTVFLKSETESKSTLLAAKVKDNKGKEVDQPAPDC